MLGFTSKFVYLSFPMSFRIIASSLFMVLFCFCSSEYSDILQGDDTGKKYKKAKELYQEGDYERANRLFDQVYYIYRGTDKAEGLDYLRAKSYYELGLRLVAAEYFSNFTKDYPNNSKICEALFLTLQCYYQYSEIPQRDQTYTLATISAVQNFVDRCPKSDSVSLASDVAGSLRKKLEKKAYGRAYFYYDNRQYKAAIVAFENYLDDYPESSYAEEVAFFKFKSKYEYAQGSIIAKQRERLIEAGTSYREYLKVLLSRNFPNTHEDLAKELYYNLEQKLKTIQDG